MKELAQEYKAKGQKGYFYRIIKREGEVILASMYREEEGGEIWGYEVFWVKKYPARKSPDGKTDIEAAEAPPPSSSWGHYAYQLNGGIKGKFKAEAYFWEMCLIQKELTDGTLKADKRGRVKRREVREMNIEQLYQEYLDSK